MFSVFFIRYAKKSVTVPVVHSNGNTTVRILETAVQADAFRVRKTLNKENAGIPGMSMKEDIRWTRNSRRHLIRGG